MDPRHFVTLAGFLAARAGAENCRTSISRSYYSLYLVVNLFMIENGIPIPKKKSECHEKVYNVLNNCGVDDLKNVAVILNELRVKRNEADYDMSLSETENPRTAQFYAERAKEAIATFDAFCAKRQESVPLVNAMKNYCEMVKLT